MHFLVIEDEYYKHILEDLSDKVPQFKSVFDKEDGVYPILGEFSRYLIENIDNEAIVSSCADFINNAIVHGGSETEDAISLQVLQPIYLESSLTEAIQAYLSPEVIKLLHKFEDASGRIIVQ